MPSIEFVRRALISCLIAAFSIGLLLWFTSGGSGGTDFDVVYAGASALRARLNPYDVVGPGRSFDWWTPLYYPLPGLVLILPLTWLPLSTAQCVFVGISAFALSYGITGRRRPWMFVMFASQGYISCIAMGQWSVLLLATLYLPMLRSIVIAKPNIGLAIASTTWSRRDIVALAIGMTSLIAVSFVAQPGWFGSWRATISRAPQYRAPIAYAGGFLLLGALLRWRRPEARYLAALALVPQSPGPYTDLLLFAIPNTRWEGLILALLSYCTLPISDRLPFLATTTERIVRYGGISVIVMMLPCLVMILRRPNVGSLPPRFERAATRLPAWLRGESQEPVDDPLVRVGRRMENVLLKTDDAS